MKKSKQKTKKIEWMKTVTRPALPLKASLFVKACDENMKREFGIGLSHHLFVPNGNQFDLMIDRDEFSALTKRVEEQASELDFFEKLIQKTYSLSELMARAGEEASQGNLKQLPQEEITERVEKFFDANIEFWFVGYTFVIADPLLQKILAKELKKILEKKHKEQLFQKYFQILSTTKVKLNEDETEGRELYEIKSRELYGENIKPLLAQHTKKYCWLSCYDYNLRPFNKDYFAERLNSIKAPSRESLGIEEQDEKKIRATKEILNKLKSKKLNHLARLIQEFIFLRTYRTNQFRKGIYSFFRLQHEIERRAKLQKYDLAYFTDKEVMNFLKMGQSFDREEIVRRKQSLIMIQKDEGLKVISSEWRILDIIKTELEEKETIILKGDTANPGIAEGLVRIVRGITEVKKVQKGDILVSPMTTPDMILAIKKASAIVTDEGGITCHAAVISRELDIPCVVGTKEATQKLKDGDWVKVFAGDGVIIRREQKMPDIYQQITTVAGYEHFYNILENLFQEAKKEIIIFSVGEPVPAKLEKVMKEKADKGILRRFIVTKNDQENKHFLQKYQKMGIKLKYYPARGSTFWVIDNKRSGISVRNPIFKITEKKYQEERVSILFNNANLSQSLARYFNHLWQEAKVIKV